ncbi:MAG: hypothetical protein WD928_11105 [Gammaproteobacteria bacterium]
MRADIDIGVEASALLIEYADSLLGADRARLDSARAALAARLGADAVVGAAAIAANFSKNDRIANAIGIPADRRFLEGSADFRARLGIDDFPSARNTLK